MPRYLTPPKIALLALITLYLDGQVAESARLKVLSFLASAIRVPSFDDQQDAQELLDGLSGDISSYFASLKPEASKFPGRSVYDALLTNIFRINGIDSLHGFFDSPTSLRARLHASTASEEQRKVELSPGSPLGCFIRRCHVEYTRLQFADFQTLWEAFATYRAPAWKYWADRNPDEARRVAMEEAEAGLSYPVGSSLPLSEATDQQQMSNDDAETIITFSIHRLQKLGGRIPPAMTGKLRTWIEDQRSDSGTQSLQYFLSFFEHWRAGQYSMALESLHRYFDYSLAAKTLNTESNMKIYYQYALLHLSVLHADFECWEQSVEAMAECIATARENQDTACLNFALSWLLYLRQAAPAAGPQPFNAISGIISSGNGERDELDFLKTKAKETKHWALLSTTLLEEAKVEMHASGAANRATEHITQAAYLNVQHQLRSLAPAATLFRGGFYSRIGQSHLTKRYFESVQQCREDDCPLSDRVRSTCRTAFECAHNGRFEIALRLLRDCLARVRGVLKLHQRVTAFIELVNAKRSLHQGDAATARHHLTQLAPMKDLSDPEMRYEVQLLEVESMLSQTNYAGALETVQTHIETLKKASAPDIAQHLHLLVLKANVFIRGGQPTKGFSVALRAAATAERLRLIPVMLEAIAALANILVAMSEFPAAQNLIEAALPMAIETGRQHLIAELFNTLVDARVGFAGHHCAHGSSEQLKVMRSAEAYAERSREAFARIEDYEGQLSCLGAQSRIAHWRNDEATAARIEAVYLQKVADKEARDEGW